MFKKVLPILFFIIVSFSFSQNQKENDLLKQYIIENNIDSLKIVLNKLPQSIKKDNFLKVITNNANYLDFVYFLQTNTFNKKNDLIKLNDFLNKKVKTPNNLDNVNLDFVRVKWHQINQLLENEQLDLALNETKKLEAYIAKFKKKPNEINYKKALIYAKQYEIVLNLIKQDIKNGSNLCKTNLKVAESFNDNFLVLYLKNLLKEFLIYTKDLDGYLKICREQTALENATNEKSVFYIQNIQDYIDASIFKGNFNETEIEKLLNEIYNYKDSKCYSYTNYAKYVSYSKVNSASCKRVFDKFNVKNISELCNFFIEDAKSKLNTNEEISLYDECADALYNHKNYQKAADIQDQKSLLIKKVYSQELSQSIAAFETREKDFENNKLKQINVNTETKLQAQTNIIFGISVTLILFTVLSYFLYKTAKQRNISNDNLKNANKDLNRLNILNQKIFSVISHDFKGSILGLKHFLGNDTFKNEIFNKHEIFISDFKNQIENSEKMLFSLLDWAKTELISKNNTTDTVTINSLIQQINAELLNEIKNKNLSIINKVAATETTLFNKSVLQIALRNALSNAIKYSYEGRIIEIDFNDNTILVRDYGDGIKDEKLKQLFSKNVNSSIGTQLESGFGIGLYFCQELMQKNNGNLFGQNAADGGFILGIQLKN